MASMSSLKLRSYLMWLKIYSSNGKTFDRRCRIEATNTKYFLGNDIICLIVQYYFVGYDGWMDAVTERES